MVRRPALQDAGTVEFAPKASRGTSEFQPGPRRWLPLHGRGAARGGRRGSPAGGFLLQWCPRRDSQACGSRNFKGLSRSPDHSNAPWAGLGMVAQRDSTVFVRWLFTGFYRDPRRVGPRSRGMTPAASRSIPTIQGAGQTTASVGHDRVQLPGLCPCTWLGKKLSRLAILPDRRRAV
jgi:hypothetical protein